MNAINYEKIKYHIEYGKVNNLYIHIKNGEVIVKAPRFITKKYIDKIVEQKRNWILKKLEESKNKPEEREYTKTDIENLKTKLEYILKEAGLNFKEEYIFPELIKQTNLVPNKIRIRNIKYAWGSCSSNKNITINLKLVDKSEEEIKYVVLHELCHLKYMNHSDKFWNLVEKYMPNYKEIRKQLKYNR